MPAAVPDPNPHPGVSVGAYLLDLLKQHAREADFPAQVEASTGKSMSFATLLELSVRAAEGWRALGLASGSTLAVFCRNSEMLFPAVLGAILQGVAVSGIVPTCSEEDLESRLAKLSPDAILCDSSNADLAARVGARVAPQSCFTVATDGDSGDSTRTLQDVFLAAGAPDVGTYSAADVGDLHDHVAAIYFSSGTTAQPKNIVISNYGLLTGVLYSNLALRCVRGERLLCTSLMSWVSGLGLLLSCTATATTRVCDTFTTPGALLASLRRHQANCWFTAAPLLLMVVEAVRAEAKAEAKEAQTQAAPCPSLRAVVAGGTTLAAEVEQMAARVLHCDIQQAYASTECLTITAGRKPLRPGSVGKAVPGVRLRIVDVDSGLDIETPGVPGEFRVHTPAIMKGYKDRPVASAVSFDEQRYFRTGDFGYRDQDGYVFILGRVKELLNCNGVKVAPGEFEAVLRSHPAVAEACVIGRPHATLGDVPAACVVLRPGCSVTEAELKQQVAGRLPRLQSSKAGSKGHRGGLLLLFVERIPKTPNGKVAARDVAALFDDALARIH
ncbi:probable 4-coumarate--CoA ligase 5 [Thrips palmi]|uniref:Probable 4-coumarate--CoA ligase 5 n=1 Tax=Thrips palmi TaxID=161013 RepID=A0A6P9A163_THRPL|nr:probable 4-coumarate--CoA ligase 5 [Thrips palmi]